MPISGIATFGERLQIAFLNMSKIIQSAYNLIESQKYKKAAEHLDSPEVARYPLAKVCLYGMKTDV